MSFKKGISPRITELGIISCMWAGIWILVSILLSTVIIRKGTNIPKKNEKIRTNGLFGDIGITDVFA